VNFGHHLIAQSVLDDAHSAVQVAENRKRAAQSQLAVSQAKVAEARAQVAQSQAAADRACVAQSDRQSASVFFNQLAMVPVIAGLTC
jgi:hypothetical protein